MSCESCSVRGVLSLRLLSVVFSQLAMEHPHILLLGEEFFGCVGSQVLIFSRFQMSLPIIWIWHRLMPWPGPLKTSKAA